MEVQRFKTHLRKIYATIESQFNSVRKLMLSLYRFRIFNADGEGIGETGLDVLDDYTHGECREDVGEYCVRPVTDRFAGMDSQGFHIRALWINATRIINGSRT